MVSCTGQIVTGEPQGIVSTSLKIKDSLHTFPKVF